MIDLSNGEKLIIVSHISPVIHGLTNGPSPYCLVRVMDCYLVLADT